MNTADIHLLVDEVWSIDVSSADNDSLKGGLRSLRRLTSVCEARQAVLAQAIKTTASFPEDAIGNAAGTTHGGAGKILDRAGTASDVPALGDAFGNGETTAGHLDAVTAALRDLTPTQRELFAGDHQRLALRAAAMPLHEFRRWLQTEVRRLQGDDGQAKFERQQGDTRLSMRLDPHTGMGHINGRFDPHSFALLKRRITDTVNTLFHDTTPDTAPSDPLARHEHLQALALLDIVRGAGGRPGRAEVIVVVDHTVTDPVDGGPIEDWGIDTRIPRRVLTDLLHSGDPDTYVVEVRNGVLVNLPDNIDLGRTTRIANREQRRVLRALYPRCAIPGCCTRFDHCKIHHVVFWRNGGGTDLCNLLPVCVKHHHAIHDQGWQLHLARDGTLTITFPNGTTRVTGRPRRVAA